MVEVTQIDPESVRIKIGRESINVSRSDFNIAQAQLRRQMQGRRTTIGAETAQARRAFFFLKRDPTIRKQAEAGQALKVQAFQAGFKGPQGTQEFLQVRKLAGGIKPIALSKEALQNIQKRVSEVGLEQTRKEIVQQRLKDIIKQKKGLTESQKQFLEGRVERIVPKKEEITEKELAPEKIKEEKVIAISRKERREDIAAEQKKRRDEFLDKLSQTKFSKFSKSFIEGGTEAIIGGITGLIELVKDPTKIKDVPAGIKGRILELVKLAKTDKPKFLGAVTGEILLLKGIKVKPTTKSLVKSGKNFIIETPGRIKKTPLTKTFPKEFKFKIDDVEVKSFVTKEASKKNINFDKLSKIEQNFLVGQVKAKIRSNPDLFIPKTRKLALKKAKIKDIKSIIKQRLEGKLNSNIVLRNTGQRILQELSSAQKLSLKRFAQRLEAKRIRKAIKKRLKIKKEKPIELLTKADKDFIVSQIKARIKADPTLTLSKKQKRLLKKAKTKTELERIQKAISKRLKIKKEKPIELSNIQKDLIRNRIKILLKTQPERFLPKARKQALKNLQKLQEKKAIKRAIKKGPTKLTSSDLLTKADKEFIKGQIKSQFRTKPEKFIPSARRQLLIQIQKTKVVKEIPTFKIIPKELTSTQKLVLKRINKLKKKDVVIKKEIQTINTKQIIINKQIKQNLSQAKRTKSKLVQRQKQKFVKKLKQQKQKLQQRIKTKQKIKLRGLQRAKSLLRPLQTQLIVPKIAQILKQPEKIKLVPKIKQILKSIAKLKLDLKQAKTIKARANLKQLLKQAQKKLRLRSRIKKLKKAKKLKKKQQAFDVFARPIKKFKKQKRPKLIKVNKVPLKKRRAKDVRNYIADTSLARTASIKKTPGSPKNPILDVPKGYAKKTKKKFRKYKQVKGKRKPLQKGKVIEKRKNLLDTKGEKKGITLRRRILQITPKKPKVRIKKVMRRKTTYRKIKRKSVKRILSDKQLMALKKGREKRMRNLKK